MIHRTESRRSTDTAAAILAATLAGMVILAGMISATPGASASVQESGAYTCPDCGCENDGKSYDEPGRCERCGMQLMRRDEKRNVAILLFEGVQIIDYTGPYEVFGQVGPFNVYTVSETGETLTTSMDMSVNPKYSFADAPEPDILVIPGGAAHVAYDNPKVVAWVKAKAEGAEYVMSVCNGAFILAKAGLLDGKKATTFYGLIDALREFTPRTEVVTDQRFVDNGKVITSAGLSSGIDASLHLVSKIRGEARARNLALHLEYQWDPDSGFARASLADLRLPDIEPPDGSATALVLTEGDRNRWTRRYEVTGGMSAGELQAYVVERISALKGWKVAGTEGVAPGRETAWTYEDGEGGRWRGATLVEPGTKEGTHLVTMRIERAGERQAARR